MVFLKSRKIGIFIAAVCLTAAVLSVWLLLGKENRQAAVSESDIPSETGYISPYKGELGSAGSLTGRTAIVSIFTDDAGTSWDRESDDDAEMIDDTLDNLRISTEYLTEQAARFGSDAGFIWDWQTNPELYYTASFEESLVTEYGDMYEVQKNWVLENIDETEIKNIFHADNVIYLFFFNTDYSNQVNPWYLGYSCSSDYYVEFCNIYVKFDDVFITKPASYAHEMMHCFGAHDLYYANEFINQKYVDYLNDHFSNDIMYTVVDSKEITNEFTELDAYYVGILDHCGDVDKWNLAVSEHIHNDE